MCSRSSLLNRASSDLSKQRKEKCFRELGEAVGSLRKKRLGGGINISPAPALCQNVEWKTEAAGESTRDDGPLGKAVGLCLFAD